MRLTSKGQVTIPQAVRVAAGLAPGSEVEFRVEHGRVWLEKTEADGDVRRQRVLDTIDAVAGSATANRNLGTDGILQLTRGDD